MKLTVRRRHADGKLDEVVFKVEHACLGEDCKCPNLGKEKMDMMLVDVEFQANNALPLNNERGAVRVWIDED